MHDIDWFKTVDGYAEAHFGHGIRAFKIKNGLQIYFPNPMDPGYAVIRETPEGTWNGEGLPPAGTVCEIKGCMSHYLQWNKVTVFAVRGKTVFFDMEDGRWGQTDSHEIRPFRTSEQIAADERAKAVHEMADVLRGHAPQNVTAAFAMYDAGYRKQVAE